VGLILFRPRTFPKGGETIFTDDRREIHCLAVVPLLKPELAFKLRLGADTLESRLMAAGITELLDPRRRSAVPDQYR
jgi:hypothetical protein